MILNNKIKAETAEEHEQVQTIAGMRERIIKARLFDPLVSQVFRISNVEKLSGEDTYTLMAYHSLIAKEELQNRLLEYTQNALNPIYLQVRESDLKDTVSRLEYLAILRMLVSRATLIDRWRAWRRPGHWLNVARREIAIG